MPRSSCLPASHLPAGLQNSMVRPSLPPPPLEVRVLLPAQQPHQETPSLRTTTTSREEVEARELGSITCPHRPPPSPTLSQASIASTASSGSFEMRIIQCKGYDPDCTDIRFWKQIQADSPKQREERLRQAWRQLQPWKQVNWFHWNREKFDRGFHWIQTLLKVHPLPETCDWYPILL